MDIVIYCIQYRDFKEVSMDYQKSAKEVLQAIGGADNIVSAAHCATRLRLVIADNSKVEKKTLENIDGVKGVFEAQGQLQIIFGTGEVNKVYEQFIKLGNIGASSTEELKKQAAKQGNIFQYMIKILGDIFVPIIPAIVASGFLMGIMNSLDFMVNNNFLNIDTSSSLYVFANLFSNTAYVFLPILIGFSAAKVFGGNPFLGAVMGMIMIHPNLQNAWTLAEQGVQSMQPVFFGLYSIEMVGYQGHVIPIIISVWVMSEIEKRLHKVVPAMLDLFVTPLVSIFIAGYLALSIIGPVFVKLENGILDGVQYLIGMPFGIGSFVMGIFYAPTVVMGIHHMYTTIDLGQIGKFGVTYWLPLASACNIAQGAACLAVGLKARDPKIKSLGLPASLSAFLGITEPALFGVNLRFFRPFIAGCIGGAAGAVYASLTHIGATGTGVTGIFGILLFLDYPLHYIVLFILSSAVAFVIAWLITPGKVIDAGLEEVESSKKTQVKDDKEEVNVNTEKAEEAKQVSPIISSPLKGTVVDMEETNDPTFIAGILGKGIAVVPSEGVVYAPDDAEIVTLMGHAVAFRLNNGAEMIVHVGINTVTLEGKHYEALVKVGDKVKKGDKLLKFDIEAIKKEGYPIITPVIVTNTFEFKNIDIKAKTDTKVDLDDQIFEVSANEK
jgi:PTS system, glucose subfamily, IIA component